ncbi:MAG: response regulator [Magnetococcus sp. YQC-3]
MIHDPTAPPPEKRGTVLLVDDQPEHIDVIKAALERQFVVKIATHGALGLRLATQDRVDLILLDIMMPGMDGFELCRLLKSQPETQDIPVVFLTAKHNFDDETLGLTLGAVDFIRKPSNPAVVLTRVRNLVDLHKTKQELLQRNEELLHTLRIREDMENLSRHDLKGPLVGIIGLPELLLEDTNLTEEQRQLLKVIETNGYTMLEMINRSLDLFKMESGTYQLQAKPFDLLALLHKIVSDLEKHLSGYHVSVAIRAEEEILPVMGERLLSYSLFHNLLLNAIQASAVGGEITVQISSQGDLRTVLVTNPGTVPEAIRGHFFDKYVTSGKQGGTGLGTYSAWLSAKTQGGSIRLESDRPGFTTIAVSLPGAVTLEE